MAKARAWRSTGKARKRTHAAATLSQTAMPTRERLAKAAEAGLEAGLEPGLTAFEIGGLGPRRVVRMLDAPLEQMRARAQLTEPQYLALTRFRLHWFLAHQAGNLHAIDLNRMVLHGGHGDVAEQEVWHCEMFGVAWRALGALEREVTASVVFEEFNINGVGASLGYRSPYRGRQAILKCLGNVVQKITSAWLTIDRLRD